MGPLYKLADKLNRLTEARIALVKEKTPQSTSLRPADIKDAPAILDLTERLIDTLKIVRGYYRALAAWNPDHPELDDADRAMLLALLEPDQGEATSE